MTKIKLHFAQRDYEADLSQPLDISLELRNGYPQVNAFFAPPFQAAPMTFGDWTGSIAAGSAVNCFDIKINPHGNGTHTECVGHISSEPFAINDTICSVCTVAQLISVFPQLLDNGDRVIDTLHLQQLWEPAGEEALIIRSLPNDSAKADRMYSGSNPPYFTADAIAYIAEQGICHLLTDLPSVDREDDGGRLAAHKAFWDYPGPAVRTGCTITELIYVKDLIGDGFYFLNLQTINIDLDASPSRPVLYRLTEL